MTRPSSVRASRQPPSPPCAGIPVADLEPRLRGLVRRELLDREIDPRSPERGQYAFVQALIREVAYNTLSQEGPQEAAPGRGALLRVAGH